MSENITDFKDQVSSVVIANLALSLLCGNLVHTVKWNKIIPLNNRREITGSGQNSAATATLSWSFIGLHTFVQLNSIIHQRQQLCLVRARKHQRRNSHGLYNLQQVLNLGSCLDKTLNSVEVLEKYLISLLGHQNSFKFTTLSKTIFMHEQYLTSVSYFKGCLCTSDAIVSQTQSFSISIVVESSILGNAINHGRRSKNYTWLHDVI